MYPFAFMAGFILLRVAYAYITQNNRLQLTKLLACTALLFAIFAAPFALQQLGNVPNQEVKDDLALGLQVYAQPPGLYFVRSLPGYYEADARTMYLGLVVIVTAVIPMILRKYGAKYAFWLIVSSVFILYAVGRYSPLNLAQLVHDYVPFMYFIRVPGRALIIGSLGLSMLAGMGIATLLERIPYKRIGIALACLAIVGVYADLTIGYEPIIMSEPKTNVSAYEFIRNQPEEFRVVQIPSTNTQMAVADISLNHEVFSGTVWAYNYFEPLKPLAAQYDSYLDGTSDAKLVATYGIKYIMIDTDINRFNYIMQALIDINGPDYSTLLGLNLALDIDNDYVKVFEDGGVTIYENVHYQGIVFGNGVVDYSSPNPNKMVIEIDTPAPTEVTVSQCYTKDWATNVGTLSEYQSIQLLSLPAGKYTVTLTYTDYYKSMVIWAICIFVGVVLSILLAKYKKLLS